MHHKVLLTKARVLSICLILAAGMAINQYGRQILFYAKYVPNIQPARSKILLVWNHWFGEQETIERLKIAAKRLNIDLRVVKNSDEYKKSIKIPNPERVAARIFKPDIYLALESFQMRIPHVPSYMALTLGVERYLKDNNGKTEFIEPTVANYDGILYSFAYTDDLKNAMESHGKKFVGMEWLSLVYDTEFAPATPKKMLYSGGILWDQTRSSNEFKELFQLLDKAGYLEVCGTKEKWQHLENSYIGFIPIDGHSLIERIHDDGIALVFHTEGHIKSAAPTSRIFEAVAANAVVISDHHPFIEQVFGTNVLYVDTKQNAQQMFKQIDDHMRWIKQHPQQAQQMASNCHKIFKERYTLERQLLNLIALNESKANPASYFKKFKNIKELPISKLPKALQQTLQDEEISHNNWTLLVAADNKLEFYNDNMPNSSMRKAIILMQKITELREESYKIPDGYYLFSLHDGVQKAYSWPVLGFASVANLVANHKVVLIPDNEALTGYNELFDKIRQTNKVYSWSDKINKIFWRGSATGLYLDPNTKKTYPRLEFVRYAKDKNFIDAKFSSYPVEYSKQYKHYLSKEFPLGNYVSPTDSLQYKYLFDIDGHSCSYERMAWIMRSNSLLLKHTSNKVQWYYDKLLPNKHYLPIAADFSNMQQQLDWAEQHPQEVQQIIANAQQLAEKIFDKSELQQALYNGLLQYHILTKQEAV